MAAPEITFQLLDRAGADRHADELVALYAEACADPPDGPGAEHAASFAERFQVQRRQPGFVLAEGRHGDYLVGYAFGMPLRTATSWWRDLTTPLPAEVTAEHPGRTFALAGLLSARPGDARASAMTCTTSSSRTGPRNEPRSLSRPRRPRRRAPPVSGAGGR